MDNIAELMDPGGIAEALSDDIPDLQSSPKSFLAEQEEKPNEVLKMVDSDILDLARQVGDEMDEESQAASSTDLSFLTDAVTKEADEEEDDPALSFLVGSGKMEVTNADLDFLDEEGHLSEAGSSEESDVYEDESEDEREEGEEEDEDSDSNSSDKDDKDMKRGDTEDQEDGVFGQVSFYDDDSTAMEKAKTVKPKKEKKKAKTRKKKRKVAEDGDEDEEEKPAKKRRRQKKKKADTKEDNEDGDGEDVLNSGTTQMRRKNIRSILSEKDLDKDMLSAQNEELERQKRLMELKKSLLKENAAGLAAKAAAAAAAKVATTADLTSSSSTTAVVVKSEPTTKTATTSAGTSPPREKDSQLKSLLQVAEEEAEKEAEVKAKKLEISKIKKETRDTSPPSDIITLSSDSESSEEDEDDSDNAVMVSSDEEDEIGDPEDVNNAGAHIDDSLNLPDEQGRVKVNVGHPAEDPDIYLAPQIAQAIKPHQIGGVRFLYDNVLESLERFRTTPGFGCILAHSMGLGKTIQLISFIDIFIRCAQGKRVLCIVPINTLQNWMAEFNYWLPPPEKLHPDDNLTQSRVFPLYIINDNMKTTAARAAVIAKWKENGGVMLIGYEMFRLLSSKKAAPSKAKSRSKKAEVIDVEEEDKNKSLMIDMHAMLVDPGPDLVMCDEGHRIKNSSAAISQALKTIKTRRRVVLTGYPLQNNLMEYWCMVDFVRPNFLGTKTEFSNMFERPIMNGQCLDSTGSDKKIMRHRSYVLHNLLEGFVQRRGHTVLQVNLPPKLEHVFLVRMSPIQRKIYVEFMNAITESGLCSWANNNPLKAFAVCCKIWNHPDILHEVLTKHIADKDNDLDIETGEGGANKKKKKPGLPKSESTASIASTDSTATAASTSTVDPTPPPLTPSASTASLTSMASETTNEKNPITYDWAEPLMQEYVAGVVENSGKFVLMYGLIEECLAVGDKVLIFSQSLLTLNKIEEFFGRMRVPRIEINETWQRNKTYFRLDGSTSAQEREKLINQFNDPCGNAWVFLLSTKAGCLGINLVAANRVIVIDASWNPCHDCQAICRVYRFGQVKSSYVYRLITENTLERRIYDRQISKQGMSDRIVDDMNPENKLTRRQVENLLDFEDQEYPEQDFSNAQEKYSKDVVLVRVLQKYGQWLTKHPFTHESLLIDRKELRLSKREKRLAKEGYARDKRMNVNYTRPSYAAYYPQMGGTLPNRLPMNSRYNYAAFRRGPIVRPIASVRPMISSNAAKGDGKIKQFGGQPLRPGVTIHQVITTTEIVLPGTNTTTPSGGTTNKISAGQKILVIKTPKGVYIRTNDGKMFAVRSKSGTGLGGVVASAGAVSTGGATSTTTTTTLTSADGNRVFVTPGAAGLTSSIGGKKPPIIIVSNKKGMAGSVVRGGSILQTLPFGNSTVMSALRPSLLKAGAIKTLDSANASTGTDSKTTLGSTSTTTSSSSTSGPKVTTLADLIADVNDSTSWEPGKKAGTSEGGTQSDGTGTGVPVNKPVIVLPSLAVRTPRSVPITQPSSTVASTSPGGGTVVIMPTKPVISMGTKRTAKAPRSRKSAKAKPVQEKEDGVAERKPGVSLLTGEVKPGVSLAVGTSVATGVSASSSTTPVFSSGSSVTTTVGAANTPTMSTSTQQPQQQQQQHQNQQQQHQPQNQQQHQPQPPAFPDLNRMWQNNFGSMPPNNQSMMPSSNSNTNNNNNNNNTSNNSSTNSNSNIAGNNSFNITNNQTQGPASIPNPTGDNMSNQTMGSFGGQQQHGTPGTPNPQPYGAMGNPYMSPGNMSQYGPGQTPSLGQNFGGSMPNQAPPYMSGFHPGGYMGPPSSPFGQNFHPSQPGQNSLSSNPQGMFGGSTTQNAAQGNFGSPSFGMQGESNQPGSFGGNSFGNNSNMQHPLFGPNQSAIQQDQGSLSSLLSDSKVEQNFSQRTPNLGPQQPPSQSSPGFMAPTNQNKQPGSMYNHETSGNFAGGQIPSSPSSVSHSVGGMLSSAAKPGANNRDTSPFSLSMLGSESNTPEFSSNRNKSSKNSSKSKGNSSAGSGTKSKSSKKKSSSSSSS
ncbi:hypothetical protein EGW08_023120, partial [Elysia chlorotica]